MKGIDIDYTKLLNLLVGDNRLVRAFFYTGSDNAENKQRGFLHWMRCNGFRVVTKQVRPETKSVSIDVEMTTDMLGLWPHYDTCVIVSGSQNFIYPIILLASRGVRIITVGFDDSMSNKLIEVSDKVINLDAHIEEIRKESNNEEV